MGAGTQDSAKGATNWFEVFEPPNTLLPKVSNGAGMTPEQMLAAARAVVESLHEDFNAALQSAIDELTRQRDLLMQADCDIDQAMKDVYRVAHEVKGQGRTFGFDLVTSIAQSLCALIERVDRNHPKLAASLNTHIDALRLVIKRRIKGDGGEVGAELVKSLWHEVEIVGGPAPKGPKLTGGNNVGLSY